MAYIDKEHGYFTPAQNDLNWAQSFRMTGRAPIAANRIFDTLQHMEDYINDTAQTASATPGLLLVVINDGDNNGVYRVLTVKETALSANGTYEKVGDILKAVSNWTTDLEPYTYVTAFIMYDTSNKWCYLFSVKEVTANTKVEQYVEYPGGYYVREGNKSGDTWAFGAWTHKVYSTTDGYDNALSGTSTNAVQNKVIKAALDNKADINGSYPNMAVGNIVPKDTDKVIENGGFLFRSTAGNSSISDGDASLIKVLGNISTSGAGVAISAIKSVGFNAFNPSNVLTDMGIVSGSIASKPGSKLAFVHVLQGIAQEGENNGYVISHKDAVPTITAVRACYNEPVDGETTYPVEYGLHYNSMSYLPPFDGYLAIEVPSSQDTTKLCVHLAWSGYRDEDYEEYWEEVKRISDSIGPIPATILLLKAGDVCDELSIESGLLIRRVSEGEEIGGFSWTSGTEIIGGVTHYIYTTSDLIGSIKESTSNIFVNNGFQYTVSVNSSGVVKIDVGTSNVSISSLGSYKIFYERKNEITSSALNSIQYKVSDFGTEEFLHTTNVIPGVVTIHYQPNLVDGLRYLLLKAITVVDSVLSTTSTNPVENRVVTNELNKKADKDGVYPNLTAGQVLAKDADSIEDNASFIFRTAGGDVSISDGNAKLIKVVGNVDLNAYATETAFTASKFKAVGFNAFNPVNKFPGYKLNADGSITADSDSTLIMVHVLPSTSGAGENNGYDITFHERYSGTCGTIGGTSQLRIGFRMAEYTGGALNDNSISIINRASHYNSQSFLAPNYGYFLINTDGVDLERICVHICWSGYRDNDYEPYSESVIDLPITTLHSWGLGKAGAVNDEINLNEAVAIKRVDRILLADCTWTRHDDTVQEPNPSYDPSDPTSPEFIDVTYTSYTTATLVGTIKNSTLNILCNEVSSELSGYEYNGISVDNSGNVTISLAAEQSWTDDTPPADRYLNYELAMYSQQDIEISPLYVVSDFGTEEFTDYSTFSIACGRAYFYYLPNLIDGLRGLLVRDLADAVRIIYVHELTLSQIKISATISGSAKTLTYVSGENVTVSNVLYGKFSDGASTPNYYYLALQAADVLHKTQLTIYTYNGSTMSSTGSSYTKANVQPLVVTPTFGTNETADNTLFHLYNGNTDTYYRWDAEFFEYVAVTTHIEPNKFYIWTTALITGQILYATFDGITDQSIYNEYMIQFPTGATIPTLSFPASVKWNLAPDLDINITYQISVVNNVGLIAGGIE